MLTVVASDKELDDVMAPSECLHLFKMRSDKPRPQHSMLWAIKTEGFKRTATLIKDEHVAKYEDCYIVPAYRRN